MQQDDESKTWPSEVWEAVHIAAADLANKIDTEILQAYLKEGEMKVVPVKDVKKYADLTGYLHDKKRDAETVNTIEARESALRQVIAKYVAFENLSRADYLIVILATHGDEVIEALSEEASS